MSVNQEEILQMAQDAGFVNFAIPPEVAVVFYRFAALVRNKALEDVAKYCDDLSIPRVNYGQSDEQWAAKVIATNIRQMKDLT